MEEKHFKQHSKANQNVTDRKKLRTTEQSKSAYVVVNNYNNEKSLSSSIFSDPPTSSDGEGCEEGRRCAITVRDGDFQ